MKFNFLKDVGISGNFFLLPFFLGTFYLKRMSEIKNTIDALNINAHIDYEKQQIAYEAPFVEDSQQVGSSINGSLDAQLYISQIDTLFQDKLGKEPIALFEEPDHFTTAQRFIFTQSSVCSSIPQEFLSIKPGQVQAELNLRRQSLEKEGNSWEKKHKLAKIELEADSLQGLFSKCEELGTIMSDFHSHQNQYLKG